MLAIPYFTTRNLRLSLLAWIAIIYDLISNVLGIWFWYSAYRYLFYHDPISKTMLAIFVPLIIANNCCKLPKTLNWAMNGMEEDYATAKVMNERTPGLGDEWLNEKWARLEGWKCTGLGNDAEDEFGKASS